MTGIRNALYIGVEPKIGVVSFYPPNMEGENYGKTTQKIDDLGFFPLFLETPIWNNPRISG